MADDEFLDILWDENPNDPLFELETIDIPRDNFDPSTPAETINRNLHKYHNYFTVGHLNARSLNKNILELKEIVRKTKFDVISISESWLTQNTPKDRFQIEGFKIFRNDRKNKRGGGVCVFVRDHYECKKIRIPNLPENPEMLWVEVTVKHKKIAIGTLYKAPKIPCRVFQEAYESLMHIYTKYDDPILSGDFNVNMLKPELNECKTLVDSIIDPFELTQLIKKPTRITNKSKTLIDLLLVKKPENVLFSGACDVPGVSDHFKIYMAYSLKKEVFKPIKVTRRDFKNFDEHGFQRAAETAMWENVFSVQNVNDKVTVFENVFTELLDTFAPYKTFTIRKPNSTPWLTSEISEVMRDRDSHKAHFNETGNNIYYEKYKFLRNKVTSMMRQSQKNMFNNTINSKVKNGRDFYSAVKKLNVITDKKNKGTVNFPANTLNQTFVKNNNFFVDDEFIDERVKTLYDKTVPCIHKFTFSVVTEQDVIKVAKTITSMSVGVDNINSYVIKLILNRISSPLTDIINSSLEQEIFPDRWKKAIIKPIPKVTIPLAANDFRPISLLPTLSKVIEKIVNIQIVQYLVKYDLLDPYQSAYKKNHSTTTALLKLNEDIFEALDDSEITLLVLLDFSKAFDTVNHKLLLAKLDILGFQSNVCGWIHSYLTGRSQKVKTDTEESDWAYIKNGVPQGSILGPLLFTILVSDMRMTIWNGSYITYADDTNLYWESPTDMVNNSIKQANSVLHNISNYCINNRLMLNVGKCKYIIMGSRYNIKKLNSIQLDPIKINNIVLERVSQAKVLGVTYDEVLSWKKQVNLSISKAVGNFLQFARYKRFLSKQSKITLCQSLVLSQFNYCDVIYSSMDVYLEKKIQNIQNLCLRFIFNINKRNYHTDYNSLLNQLGWLTMKKKTIKNGLVMMYKILNGLAPNYLADFVTLTSDIHNINTRRRNNSIWINKNITSKIHRKSFYFYIANIYNSIPQNIRQSKSVNSFKKQINTYILNGNLVIPRH